MKFAVAGIAALVLAGVPAGVVVAEVFSAPAPHMLACSETDQEDSFSMDCAPTIIPDTSDNLTEAEVAEPGWNAHPGGSSGGGGGGHGHG
ncbi:hypothetical protein [Mycobacterium sp. DL592]|uniref:hypothetical protein n=1 Tax=Mycobacterium sp. DL592 TaxID=2675524 RepID=UPI00141E8BA2|nr:hypothetical protein [Mycobacterium sp. DL592]